MKLLHVKRDGNIHHVREYEVNTLITLDSDKDYLHVSKTCQIVAINSIWETFFALSKIFHKLEVSIWKGLDLFQAVYKIV